MRFVRTLKSTPRSTEVIYDAPAKGKPLTPLAVPLPPGPAVPARKARKSFHEIKVPHSVMHSGLAKHMQFRLKEIVADHFKETKVKESMTPGKIYLRASGIYYLCPREELLASKEKVVREEKLPTSTAMLFAYGHLVHGWLQNDIFRDALYGSWRCVMCGQIHGSKDQLMPYPEECSRCGNKKLTYEELYYYNDDLHLGGHPDGFVFDAGKMQLVDFKTMHMEAYNGVDRWGISKGYIWQAQAYMFMAGLDILRLIPVNKNDPSIKEKIIRRDESIIQEVAQKCFDTIYAIESLQSKTEFFIPQRTCESKADSRAKKCAMCKLCFSMQEKEGFIKRVA